MRASGGRGQLVLNQLSAASLHLSSSSLSRRYPRILSLTLSGNLTAVGHTQAILHLQRHQGDHQCTSYCM